jgi:transcriptional regulator with XRE-family HTH domain
MVGGQVDFPAAVAKLKQVRIDRGLSVDRVAHDAGIGPSSLRNYEAFIREPDLATLQRWAVALGQRCTFDLRTADADGRAGVVAEKVAHMDELRGRAAARFVDLLEGATPGQVRAAMAAFVALIGAGEEESEELAGGSHERA